MAHKGRRLRAKPFRFQSSQNNFPEKQEMLALSEDVAFEHPLDATKGTKAALADF